MVSVRAEGERRANRRALASLLALGVTPAVSGSTGLERIVYCLALAFGAPERDVADSFKTGVRRRG